MTTHIVEIRRRTEEPSIMGDWAALTRAPITKRDAENLAAMIGPHWESRIVALESPMGREFAELERRVPFQNRPLVRWEPEAVSHHPSCEFHNERWSTHRFGSYESDALTGHQWIAEQDLMHALRSINEQATLDALGIRTVRRGEVVVHVGECKTCMARARAASVKVTITKPNESGAQLLTSTREYRL